MAIFSIDEKTWVEYNRGEVVDLWKRVGICGKLVPEFSIPAKAGIHII